MAGVKKYVGSSPAHRKEKERHGKSTKPADDYRIHTVAHGDTLWAIAKKYLGNGSRYTEIVKLNGLKSSVIYTGQKLKIPQK